MQHLFGILFCCLLLHATLEAQLPGSQAYLFDMRQVNDVEYSFSSPKYLTAFNARGYNNQPQFMDERTLYMTIQRPSANQSEIYAFDLKKKERSRVTNTPDGEYSATLMPNGTYFSCVREENDGNKTQRLWQFPLNRSNNGSRVLKNITDIGYHYWVSPTQVALFIVGEPHQLVLADIETETITKVSADIGRGFQRFPDGTLAYIEKFSEKSWYIKALNISTLKSKIITQTLPNSEDFVVAPDGTIYMGSGSKLYKYNPSYDKNWLEIGDFRYFGLKNITRLAYNGKRKLVLIDSKQ